jgi:L-fucose mutarotase
LTAIAVEEAAVMVPDEGPEPPIFQEFRSFMPHIELTPYSRFEFYEEASGPDTCLQIVTGEQRIYANLLLTVGVVQPER